MIAFDFKIKKKINYIRYITLATFQKIYNIDSWIFLDYHNKNLRLLPMNYKRNMIILLFMIYLLKNTKKYK